MNKVGTQLHKKMTYIQLKCQWNVYLQVILISQLCNIFLLIYFFLYRVIGAESGATNSDVDCESISQRKAGNIIQCIFSILCSCSRWTCLEYLVRCSGAVPIRSQNHHIVQYLQHFKFCTSRKTSYAAYDIFFILENEWEWTGMCTFWQEQLKHFCRNDLTFWGRQLCRRKSHDCFKMT